jgi:polyisoprenyl-phosphate glycosyltransferase
MSNSDERKLNLLSIAIPVHNEQDIVAELVRRTAAAAEQVCQTYGCDAEIIIVNDGSRDNTLPLLLRVTQEYPQLRVVNLHRNFGHMSALAAGLHSCNGEAVVVMDGDLQDPPEYIPAFVAEWSSGADVVYGLRTARHESAIKQALTRSFYWIMRKTTEVEIPSQVGTFGLMDKSVVQVIAQLPERSWFFAGLRAWVGGKQSFVEYDRPDRAAGKSQVGYKGLFRLARTAIFSFSKVPLRYASMLSISSGLILLFIGLWATFEKLFTNRAIPGWATYTVLIGFLGFTMSLSLAAIAEYVAIIFDEVKQRPLFLIREEFRNGQRIVPGRLPEAYANGHKHDEQNAEPIAPQEIGKALR